MEEFDDPILLVQSPRITDALNSYEMNLQPLQAQRIVDELDMELQVLDRLRARIVLRKQMMLKLVNQVHIPKISYGLNL